MIVNKILEYLSSKEISLNEAIQSEVSEMAGYIFKRQFMTERTESKTLRLSSAGNCPRQLAYGYHGFEKKGKEIDSRAKMIFWLGDLTEMTVVSLAKLAGCNLTYTGLEQTKVEIEVGGTKIIGHPDGIVDGHLLEVKSMSSFGFKKFEEGEINDSYLTQVNLYMEALNLDKCVFVAMAKDSGVLGEKIITKDPKIIKDAKENMSKVLKSTSELLPEGRYEPNDKGFYPWNCLYCSYYGVCKPNAEKVLCGRSYKLKEKKGEK